MFLLYRLHWAAFKNPRVVPFLVESGVAVNTANYTENQTAVHWCAVSGHLRALHYMSKNGGANLYAVDKRGYNALVHAVQHNQLHTVFYRIYRGISVNSTDHEGHTL